MNKILNRVLIRTRFPALTAVFLFFPMAIGLNSALFGEPLPLNEFVAAKRLLPPQDQMVPSAVAVRRGFIFFSTLDGEVVAAPLDSFVPEAGSGYRIPSEKAAVFSKGKNLPSAFLSGLVETSWGAAAFFSDIPGLSFFEPGSDFSAGGDLIAGVDSVSESGFLVRYVSVLGDLEGFRIITFAGSPSGPVFFTDSGAFIDSSARVVFTDRTPFYRGGDADFGIDCSGSSAVLRDAAGRGRILNEFPFSGAEPVYPRSAGTWACAVVRPRDHQTLGLFLADGDLSIREVGGCRGPAITSMVHVSGGFVAFRMFAPAIFVSTPGGATEEIQTLGREKLSEMAVLDATISDGRIFVVTTRGVYFVSLPDAESEKKAKPAEGGKVSE